MAGGFETAKKIVVHPLIEEPDGRGIDTRQRAQRRRNPGLARASPGGASAAGALPCAAAELARAHERMRAGSVERHLDYFYEGKIETIRVLPCPITMLPAELDYLHQVTRTLHQALLKLPELYLSEPAVRQILQLTPEEDEWLRSCWGPSHRARNPVFDRLDAMVDYSSAVWKETL